MLRLLAAVGLVIACTRARADGTGWAADEKQAFDRARAEHRGVMVELYATWCVPCEELGKKLRAPGLASEIAAKFVALRIDITDDNDKTHAARKRYGADSLPAVVFVTLDGTTVARITRLLDDAELRAIIKRAASQLSR